MTPAPWTGSAAPTTEDELWTFAKSFYGEDGVSSACLILQDRFGVDVSLLIFVVFAAVRRGVMLGADDLAVADGTIRAWRTEVVEPLRRLRRRLKSGPAPAWSLSTERLRGRVKEIEMEAERLELAALAHSIDGLIGRGNSLAGAEELPKRVARHFVRDEALDGGEVADALLILAKAVRRALDANVSPSP